MKILLTGGAGYVGSACLRWLLRHGHDPIALDNLSEGNAPSVPADRLIVGDILETEWLAEQMCQHRIEAVMHFAALALVPESIQQPQRYWKVNVGGTRSLLDAMAAASVDKILFSSTAATYSFDEPMPLTEASQQKPRVPYGTTKLAAENMIQDYASAYGWGSVILRYFNACGADPDGLHGESRRHETHLIPLIFSAALGQRDKVLVYGTDWPTRDGSCVRDYVHTEDLAQAHHKALEQLEPGTGRVYNLGTGTGTTVLEVLSACEKAIGRPIPSEKVDRRPGDPATLVAASDKARADLGWEPKYPDIDSIVSTAWRWHRDHPDGYNDEPTIARANQGE
ncbi:MAG: UDP-glucose 4-epimerase GalE [Phycisphaeraceae bacterium]|nr:UDP-glucose 4-epimerase GalE [Phycisphaeraceae bacterium]